MLPIQPPETIKVYALIKQSKLYFSYTCGSNISNIGLGFFKTLQDAEHERTAEYLKLDPNSTDAFHIFELEVPNPAYQRR